MIFELPRIYPITDTRLSGISHVQQVERLIAGGAEIIQLRDKEAPARVLYETALEAVMIARRSHFALIINDRVDIALAVEADGVHLGQHDMPPESAREILGESAVIGYSTHSVRQAAEAMRLPIDYIAIGPIFATKTKDDTEPVVGLEGLRQVRSVVGDMPVVAIGGIDLDNLYAAFEAGANSVAMIGALITPPAQIEKQMRQARSISTNIPRTSPGS